MRHDYTVSICELSVIVCVFKTTLGETSSIDTRLVVVVVVQAFIQQTTTTRVRTEYINRKRLSGLISISDFRRNSFYFVCCVSSSSAA